MANEDLAFRCFGARIEVRTDAPGLLAAIADALPPGASIVGGGDADCLFELRAQTDGHLALFEDGRPLAEALQTGAALKQLTSSLHVAMARNARGFVFVHAGVAAWKGAAIVIPGRTMSGKTSLVAALVRGGAGYFSDEYAVLDPEGRVHPFGKPLSIRDAAGDSRDVDVAAIGGRQAREPCRIGTLLHTHYEPGARWQPQQLSSARAMLAMLDNTVMVRDDPELAMQAVSLSLAGARAFAGSRGEAGDLVRQLLV